MKGRVLLGALILGVLGLGPAAIAAPANDNFSDAHGLTLGQTVETSNIDATEELLEPTPCGIGSTIWYEFLATEDGVVGFSTAGSDIDTGLAIYTGSASPPIWNLRQQDCVDDTWASLQAALTIDAQAGMTYWIQVGGFLGEQGAVTLSAYRPGSISGTALLEGSDEPAYACVTVYDGSGDEVDARGTDSRGFWHIEGLAAGAYTVRFWTCGGRPFVTEWYDDQPTQSLANTVDVVEGAETTGIDAVLTPLDGGSSPIDVAVEAISIENVPLKTDHGTQPGTGTVRDVTVTVRNVGEEAAWGWVDVRACPETAVFCQFAGGEGIWDLKPGESRTITVRWNGAGGVGDYTVTAHASFADRNYERYDENWPNNQMSVEHYLIVGGTGFGVGV